MAKGSKAFGPSLLSAWNAIYGRVRPMLAMGDFRRFFYAVCRVISLNRGDFVNVYDFFYECVRVRLYGGGPRSPGLCLISNSLTLFGGLPLNRIRLAMALRG